jgi:hypothetical protein
MYLHKIFYDYQGISESQLREFSFSANNNLNMLGILSYDVGAFPMPISYEMFANLLYPEG